MEGGSFVSPENNVRARYSPEFDLDTDLSPEFPIKEEMIEEVMQELYKEITCPSESSSATVTSPSSENIASLEFSPASVFSDNGLSESCGASVSDSASTRMAGVKFVGVEGKFAGGKVGSPENGVWAEERGFDYGEGCLVEGMMMDGCDEVEFDDEWLDRAIGWPPLEADGCS